MLSIVLAIISATAEDVASIEEIIKARCATAGGYGTTNGMIPWAAKVGGSYVFNVGPEEDCAADPSRQFISGSELWLSVAGAQDP